MACVFRAPARSDVGLDFCASASFNGCGMTRARLTALLTLLVGREVILRGAPSR
jgi:hypothetical protein